MKQSILALAGLTLAACSNEPSLLDRHVTAMGGEAALESVNAIRLELDITEPTFNVRGVYQAERPDSMRVDIYVGENRVFSEGLDDGAGWQMFADGSIEATSPEGTLALLRGLHGNLYGAHEYAALGHTITEGEPAEIDGVVYPTLDFLMSDGFEERLYLDPETFLPVRDRSEYALHPDVNPDQEFHETRRSEFTMIEGVMFPMLQETVDLRTGEVVQTVRIVSVEINPEFEPGVFAMPSEE
ncbi:hypothetical protein V0U79_08695 [Hyphobacterium sp. HN65]|uniref:DUF4292 domain-containing protein n=1 Tax=Hyphobacterium lacteum TaxID=3116575 RepID=A0ABU7LRA6_9PROT|nr:hypothetical protein [Hyphobacterium sp. HN65]MEE2526443.1 hypothetical protein [Hyphobacterium sp. HN65]